MRYILKNKWTLEISRKSSINVSIDYNDYNAPDDMLMNNAKIKKKLEMFDLGLILFYSATGGNGIIDFSQYLCSHQETKQNKCCCFYHCLEKHENEKLKFKINSTYMVSKTYSPEFLSFLCMLTSYSLNPNIVTGDKIKNHSWLINSNSDSKEREILLNLEELLKVSNITSKKLSFITLEKLCENISLILQSCKDSFLQLNKNSSNTIKFSRLVLDELSNNLNIDKESLLEKIKSVYDSILSSIIP